LTTIGTRVITVCVIKYCSSVVWALGYLVFKRCLFVALALSASALTACGGSAATGIAPDLQHRSAQSMYNPNNPPDPGCGASQQNCNPVPVVPVNPGTGACQDDPSACATPPPSPAPTGVAFSGKPQDGQKCGLGSNGLDIGQYIGVINTNNQPVAQYVANENAIVGGSAQMTIISPTQVAINTPVLGWIYKDQTGHFWISQNVDQAPSFSVGVNAWFASFAINSKSDGTPHYVGPNPPVTNQNETTMTCWPQTNTAWA
jgi:hypothetical protein